MDVAATAAHNAYTMNSAKAYEWSDAIEGVTMSTLDELARSYRFAKRVTERLADELNFDEQQQAQVEAVIVIEHRNVTPLLRQVACHRRQLRNTLWHDPFTAAKLMRAHAGWQARTQIELQAAKRRVRLMIYNLLLPEQQELMRGGIERQTRTNRSGEATETYELTEGKRQSYLTTRIGNNRSPQAPVIRRAYDAVSSS